MEGAGKAGLAAKAGAWRSASALPAAVPAVCCTERRQSRPRLRTQAIAANGSQRRLVLDSEPTLVPPAVALAQPVAGRLALPDVSPQQPSSAFDARSTVHRGEHDAQQEQQEQHTNADAAAHVAEAVPEARNSALWALGIMTLGYLHLSVTLYALPSLVPYISADLHLNDTQGALLTTGYTILYGLVLVPMGIIADFANRPKLLAGGIAVWSLLTMAASQATSFPQLIATRVGFAAAQATCNPVAYSLLPELFPNNRTLASAFYCTAIYLGRAGAFAVLLLAGSQGGDAAGAALDAAADPAWRHVLFWLGPPGLVLAAVAMATVEEPRKKGGSGRFLPLVTLGSDSEDEGEGDAQRAQRGGTPALGPAGLALALQPGAAGGRTLVTAPETAGPVDIQDSLRQLPGLVSNPSFVALTAATAFGDVASWALIGWQGLFYARVYELEPSVYAPLVAVGICVGGIVGGIGSGLFGDRLTSKGKRGWLTAGTSIAAAPLMAASFLLPDYRQSFVVLLFGYALSECWRAPAAVMVREVSPAGMGSTASAINLCVRQLAGSLGPLGVAWLSSEYDLQSAMLLIPACHLACGVGLAIAERVITEEKARTKAARHAEHAEHAL